MHEEYTFHYVLTELGLCRDGEETILKEDCHAFLLDDRVADLKVRMQVSRHGAEQPTVRKRVVMYKDEDCKDFAEAHNMYENWKDGFYKPKSISVDAPVNEEHRRIVPKELRRCSCGA